MHALTVFSFHIGALFLVCKGYKEFKILNSFLYQSVISSNRAGLGVRSSFSGLTPAWSLEYLWAASSLCASSVRYSSGIFPRSTPSGSGTLSSSDSGRGIR